jgi:hypothetical protein
MAYSYPCHCGYGGAHCLHCWKNDVATLLTRHLSGATEPEQVYNVFFESTASTEWRRICALWSPTIRYSGVFTHQKPYVHFDWPATVPRRCELADLLVVLTDHAAHTRYAWLLQAKTSKHWPPANVDQWDLNLHWPDVRYSGDPSVAPVGGKSWPVTRSLPFAGAADKAAQYLILEKILAAATTTECVVHAIWTDLATSIEGMLGGSNGELFSWSDAAAATDWDRLAGI